MIMSDTRIGLFFSVERDPVEGHPGFHFLNDSLDF